MINFIISQLRGAETSGQRPAGYLQEYLDAAVKNNGVMIELPDDKAALLRSKYAHLPRLTSVRPLVRVPVRDPSQPAPPPVDPRVLAHVQRQAGPCRGCGD